MNMRAKCVYILPFLGHFGKFGDDIASIIEAD